MQGYREASAVLAGRFLEMGRKGWGLEISQVAKKGTQDSCEAGPVGTGSV